MSGSLFLIPTYLSQENTNRFLAPIIFDVLRNCDTYFVENIRTARRFISSLKLGIEIDDLHFEQLDKKTTWDDLYVKFEPIRAGKDVGVISEAGLPCLADPGNMAVGFAHQTGISVIPLPGSSSIQLGLIASGFGGQHFTFHGYLPIEKKERIRSLHELEKLVQTGYTQIFMETPYRNHQLLEDIFSTCNPHLHLSIAADISGSKEWIKTYPIAQWKKQHFNIHKVPAIFSFGQYS